MDWQKFISRKIGVVAASAWFLQQGELPAEWFAGIAIAYLVGQSVVDAIEKWRAK